MVIKRMAVGVLGTNCYVVSTKDKNAFVVDPGDDARRIKAYIKQEGIKVKFIINTHSHIDHIGADCDLGFPVYIHKLDAPALEDPTKNCSSFVFGEFKACKPAKLLADKDIIKLDELEIEVMHTPGHTRGGICLKVGSVVFTGDTLFKDGIGRTDLPGGSFETIISSIKNKLLCLEDSVEIYPGHGEASTIGMERGNF